METVEKMVHCVPTWLTDYGTESGFARLKPLPLRSYLPWHLDARVVEPQVPGPLGEHGAGEDIDFAPEIGPLDNIADLEEDQEEPDFAAPAGPAFHDPMADTSGSIETPGLEHIIHNATNDLHRCMRGYDTVVKHMREVCRLICKRESRQRLMATCYDSTGPIGKVMGESLAGFDAHVHTERWGTVAYAAINLMRVRDSLQWGWTGRSGEEDLALESVHLCIHSSTRPSMHPSIRDLTSLLSCGRHWFCWPLITLRGCP